MRTVTVEELQSELSGYLHEVQGGEEIVIRDKDVPVARILPFRPRTQAEHEAELVKSGRMRLPTKKMDWDAFFRMPAADVPHEVAVRAAIEGRGDR